MAVERLAGLVDGELPMDFDALGLALVAPAIDLVGQLRLARNAPLQALAAQGREVELELVEPRAALGRVDEAEAGSQRVGLAGGKAVVKGADCGRI